MLFRSASSKRLLALLLLLWIAAVLLVSPLCATDGDDDHDGDDGGEAGAQTPLRIGVTFRPASCDRKSKHGDTLRMHYTGSLLDGTVFDSSLTRGEPFQFRLGMGQVIQGWDQGLSNMCVGEKRRLKIPPHLGYGDRGAGGSIPPGATLIFEVELMGIQ